MNCAVVRETENATRSMVYGPALLGGPPLVTTGPTLTDKVGEPSEGHRRYN